MGAALTGSSLSFTTSATTRTTTVARGWSLPWAEAGSSAVHRPSA
jgi:hypothetical protein